GVDTPVGVRAVAVHVAPGARHASFSHQTGILVRAVRIVGPEIPLHVIVTQAGIRKAPLAADEMRELHRVAHEEDRCVIADEIVVAFAGVELQRKAAYVAPCVRAGLSQIFVVNGLLTISGEIPVPELWSVPMILNAIAEKLKRQSKEDFKGRHFEARLIVQAVTWYLRYPLSYRDLEEMFRERGFEVDHSTVNRWVLAYAPMIEKRLRQFRRPHCGSIRIDETYVKIRG